MTETTPGAMSNALRLARHDVTCASYGAFSVTVVERLFSNPRVGFTQHFCSPTMPNRCFFTFPNPTVHQQGGSMNPPSQTRRTELPKARRRWCWKRS